VDTSDLRRLALEVDDEHREAMQTFRDEVAASVFDADEQRRASRRAFLRRLGVGGAITAGCVALPALRAAAQSSTTTPSTTVAQGATSAAPATTTTTLPRRPTQADTVILNFGQSLELALVQGYDAALASGKLSEDNTFVAQVFRQHHLEHGQAFGGLLGRAALGVVNGSLVAAYGPRLQAAADEKALLSIALELEEAAAATYLGGLGQLESLDTASLAASILPIESRHAVVLAQAAGLPFNQYVPEFQTTSGALSPTQYPIQEP